VTLYPHGLVQLTDGSSQTRTLNPKDSLKNTLFTVLCVSKMYLDEATMPPMQKRGTRAVANTF
jgi:hypothetical protein